MPDLGPPPELDWIEIAVFYGAGFGSIVLVLFLLMMVVLWWIGD